MDGHVTILGYRKGAQRVLVGISEGERIFGKRKLMLDDHIMDIRKICCKCIT
jgi:hypothetical protein